MGRGRLDASSSFPRSAGGVVVPLELLLFLPVRASRVAPPPALHLCCHRTHFTLRGICSGNFVCRRGSPPADLSLEMPQPHGGPFPCSHTPQVCVVQMNTCMLVCMGAWVHGCMGAWARGCMGAWARGCMGAWVHGCMGAWVHGCMGTSPVCAWLGASTGTSLLAGLDCLWVTMGAYDD